jgi:hypothetical protein
MLPGKKHIGRPKVTGPAEITTPRRLVDDGTSVTQAARTLKISRSTAYAALKEQRSGKYRQGLIGVISIGVRAGQLGRTDAWLSSHLVSHV